jgi:L-aminopeptidase/D-esterase-like protein
MWDLLLGVVRVGRVLSPAAARRDDSGSIIVVVATDAPLMPHQLKRLARRVSLGMARDGAISGNGSGDIFIAFSTANSNAARTTGTVTLSMIPNDRMNPLFYGVVEATEESIVNAMIAADTMVGADDRKAYGLPHDELRRVLARFGRLLEPQGR